MEYVKITKNDLNSLIEKRVTPSLAHPFSEKAYSVRLTMAEVFSFVRQYEEILLKWGSDAFYVQKGYRSQQVSSIFEKKEYASFFKTLLEILLQNYFFSFTIFDQTMQIIQRSKGWEGQYAHQTSLQFIISYLDDCNANIFLNSSNNLLKCSGDGSLYLIDRFLEILQASIQAEIFAREFLPISPTEAAGQKFFDDLLNHYKKVQVICVDLEFINNYINIYADFTLSVLRIIPSFIDTIIESSDQILDIYTKLLPNGDYGLNLHCVFILQAAKTPIEEESFMASLDCQLKANQPLTAILFDWKLVNWNQIVRDSFSTKSIGVIKASDQESVREFKYWILSPLFSFEQVFNFNFGFENNILTFIESCKRQRLHELRAHREAQAQNIKAISKFTSFNGPSTLASKKISGFESDNIAYLKAAHSIYSEYDNNLVFDELDNSLQDSLYPNEVFLEQLIDSPVVLIDLPNHLQLENLTGEDLYKRLTRLGKLWYEVFGYGKELDIYLRLSPSLTIASKSVRVFREFIITHNLQFKVSSSFSVPDIYRLQNLITELKEKVKLERPKKSIHSSIQKRIKNDSDYLKCILHGKTIIYRVDFKGNLEGRPLNQKELSKLFTNFMQVGRQAKPLSWLRGYLVRWDQRIINEGEKIDYADITLVFDSNKKNVDLEILPELQKYLSKFVERKAVEESKIHHLDMTIEPKTIWSSIEELNLNKLVIENDQSFKRKILLEKYLPALEYLDLFIEVDSPPPKRFTTGSMPKIKENTSTTKPKKV